jgi:hypothetical protein
MFGAAHNLPRLKEFSMPDTGSYLLLGLAVTTVILGFYTLSLWLRQRNLDRDLELIRKLAEDDQ